MSCQIEDLHAQFGCLARGESKLKVNIEIQSVITITTSTMTTMMMTAVATGNEGNKNEIIFLEMKNIKMEIRHQRETGDADTTEHRVKEVRRD